MKYIIEKDTNKTWNIDGDCYEKFKHEIYSYVVHDMCTFLTRNGMGNFLRFDIDYVHNPYIDVSDRLTFMFEPCGSGVVKFIRSNMDDEYTSEEVEHLHIFLLKLPVDEMFSDEKLVDYYLKLTQLIFEANELKSGVLIKKD